MSRSNDKFVILAALGIICTVIGAVVLFYGTIIAIAVHFIHKFW